MPNATVAADLTLNAAGERIPHPLVFPPSAEVRRTTAAGYSVSTIWNGQSRSAATLSLAIKMTGKGTARALSVLDLDGFVAGRNITD